jgi:hypothetical protein
VIAWAGFVGAWKGECLSRSSRVQDPVVCYLSVRSCSDSYLIFSSLTMKIRTCKLQRRISYIMCLSPRNVLPQQELQHDSPQYVPVTPNFKAKTEYIPLCVPGSIFTHKATNSEINSITNVYYIESYYKTSYKTERSTQWKQAPHHRQMTGAHTPRRSLHQRTLYLLSSRA